MMLASRGADLDVLFSIIELGIVWHADRENGCGCLSGIVLVGE